MTNETSPWVLKYFPTSIEEMVLTQDLSKLFKDIIETKKISNYSFFGKAGCGKTTLAKLLVNKIGCESMFQPCSIDGSIDMIKTTVKNFCDIVPRDQYKIIILDEADQLSQQAQMALRNIIVDSMEKCRFILTANYEDKVIDALKSRCTPIKIEFSSKDILTHCVNILKKENIKYEKEQLLNFYNNVIVHRYPDIRSIIENLQLMTHSGELKVLKSNEIDIQNEVLNFIVNNIKTEKIKKLREYWIQNEDKFSADYVKLAHDLFNVYDDNPEIMIIISDILWRMSFQLDKEIQFTNMILNIKNTIK